MRRTGAMVGFCAGVALFSGHAVAGDEVIFWNNVLLQTVRETGGAPCPVSRASAMMHAAVYDAVNSIDRTHTPYMVSLAASPDASREAAAARAARDVLVHIFPERQALYDVHLTTRLNMIADGPGKTAGINLGRDVASTLMTARAADGWDANPVYVPGVGPGHWQPTPPGNVAFTPHWGDCLPWTMQSNTQFRPPPPPDLASAEYAAAYNEVKAYGDRFSTVRTEEQTRIAYFWANDVDGTYKPPGHLNMITQQVSQQQGLSLSENARLFALVNLAMADAGIVSWDAKYNTPMDFWRPDQGIHNGDSDGNPNTAGDPNWVQLNAFQPPFPAYISGHATFGAAHAAAMAAFFGTDNMTFTISSEDPFYAAIEGAPEWRTYHSFSEAAWENAESRIWLGVHWRFDAEWGHWSGMQLGAFVGENFLLVVPAPAAAGPVGVALALLAARRRRRGGDAGAA